MQNALSLFIGSVEAGLFEPDAGSEVEAAKSAQVTILKSTIKSVFVIGGVTGETDDIEAEVPRAEPEH